MSGDVPAAERLGAQLQVLAGMARAFAEVATAPEALCQTVARETANALHAYCIVGIVSADGEWFDPVALFDGGGGDVAATLRRLLAVDRIRVDGPHPLAHGLRTGDVAVLPAMTPELARTRFTRPEEQEAAIALDIRTAMFVPLIARGATLGGFIVARYGASTTAFDDADVRFARHIAAHAALALANARLVDESRRQAERLQILSELTLELATTTGDYRALTDLIARRLMEVLGEWCSIRVLGRDRRHFETDVAVHHRDPQIAAMHRDVLRVTAPSIDEGLSGRVLATGKAMLLAQVDREEVSALTRPELRALIERLAPRSVLAVPLRVEGAPIGVAIMGRSAAQPPYTQDDLRLLEDLAAHASIAITNARLVEERRRNAERVRTLSEASKDFAGATGDLQRLLDMVTRRLAETIGELCVIRTIDDHGRILDHGASAYHPDPEVVAVARQLIALPQRTGEGISGRVAVTGQPIRITTESATEFADQTEPRYRALLQRLGTRSVLAVPLLAHGRVAGVITLTRWSTGEPYSDDDLLFAQDLASHAALAISNSRLLAAAQAELAERRRAEQELVNTQEQLRQAQKMEAVGRLAGGVAHDFNNMLSVILSYCSFLSDDLAADNPMRADLGEIRQAGERAADLTRQLLAFSRQQVTEPRILDLNEVVRGIDKMLHRLVGEEVSLRILPAPRLGRVKADPGHLEQVIMNLAVNARDAMPSGGTLTLETANVELDARYAREHLGITAGPHVMLAVSDTGTGMDKATQERMFEPFFTTKERGKGTGLGLATVFGIVKQAGGNIWVYSELGKGTTFKVYLPQTEEVAHARTGTVEIATLRGSETILLVEDDEQVRVVARGILKRNGYNLLEARDGDEAIRLCTDHPGTIDLLLTDVVMPRMSGRELSELLLVRRPTMKVLFMSGYTEDAIIQHRVVSPGVALLQKPLTPKALLRKVRAVLDGWE